MPRLFQEFICKFKNCLFFSVLEAFDYVLFHLLNSSAPTFLFGSFYDLYFFTTNFIQILYCVSNFTEFSEVFYTIFAFLKINTQKSVNVFFFVIYCRGYCVSLEIFYYFSSLCILYPYIVICYHSVCLDISLKSHVVTHGAFGK